MKGHRRDPAGELEKGSEGERREVGQALHDTVCQSLGGLGIMAKLLARRAKAGQVVGPGDLDELASMTERALEEARALSRSLLPVQRESAGLMSSLEELAAHPSRTTPCAFICESPVLVADAPSAEALYRLAEEAIRLMIDRAKPTSITITLSESDGRVSLQIRDDAAIAPRSDADAPANQG